MFTGIIHHCGELIHCENFEQGMHLTINSNFDQWVLGESISVDGICLTVRDFASKSFSCDLSPETLRVSTAKNFKLGQKVNLERALCVGDRMGGHWVNGHVDNVGLVEQVSWQGHYYFMRINCAQHLEMLRYLVPKGSITINGVSLTINALDEQGFELMLIPETLRVTNLSTLAPGDLVNIEIDWVSKLIVRQCESWLNQQH